MRMNGTNQSPDGTRPPLRLRAHDVEVWRASLDEQADETVQWLESLLAGDELDRARRFFFARDRRRYVVGRGILRVILGRYVGVAPAELRFAYGPNGKPALATERGETPPIFFNVAHSDGLALYAFCRAGEVGIDVERVRDLPDCEDVAQAAFSPRELARLRACPPERRREEFFRAWARQEAVLKALGTGLSEVSRRDCETPFSVYPLHVDEGYVAALAIGPGAQRPGAIFGWDELKADRRSAKQLETNSI